MSIHFHSLRVKEVRKETGDCVSVSFEVPEDLQEHFRFKQGQSLTLRKSFDNEEVRRTYSICSSPLEGEWKVAIKRVDGGRFSAYANDELKKGDMLEVMQPVGKFYTELNPDNNKKYLAFAAGSGITLNVISVMNPSVPHEPVYSFGRS